MNMTTKDFRCIGNKKEQLHREYPVYYTQKGILGEWRYMFLKDIDPKIYKWWANGHFSLKKE